MSTFRYEFQPWSIGREFLTQKEASDVARKALIEVMGRHAKVHARGGSPKGGAQKKYSESYKQARREAGLGTRTTLRVGGSLLNSRQVRPLQWGAELYFDGEHVETPLKRRGAKRKKPKASKPAKTLSNAELAYKLARKGFHINELGQPDLKIIGLHVGELVARKLQALVKNE